MNEILQYQNSAESIRYLKAQRAGYSGAKKIHLGFEAVALMVGITIPLFYIFLPEYKTMVGFIGAILSIIGLVVDWKQKKLTKTAASIQEMFDRKLFKLPNNNFANTEDVPMEKIVALAKKCPDAMTNWYSENITPFIPHKIAVIICQKANLTWDMAVRKKYRVCMSILVLVYFFVFAAALVGKDHDTSDLLKHIFLLLVGAAAFIKYAYSVLSENSDIIKEKTGLNLAIEKIVTEFYKSGKEPSIGNLSNIQTVIYNTRKKSTKVPDWFNNYYSKKLEQEMNDVAAAIISNIINRK
jgi:hypothetical protein